MPLVGMHRLAHARDRLPHERIHLLLPQLFGQGRGPHRVDEENGDDPALALGRALPADLLHQLGRSDDGPGSGFGRSTADPRTCPHAPQNRAPAGTFSLHVGHSRARGDPHPSQNLIPERLLNPHSGQSIQELHFLAVSLRSRARCLPRRPPRGRHSASCAGSFRASLRSRGHWVEGRRHLPAMELRQLLQRWRREPGSMSTRPTRPMSPAKRFRAHHSDAQPGSGAALPSHKPSVRQCRGYHHGHDRRLAGRAADDTPCVSRTTPACGSVRSDLLCR